MIYRFICFVLPSWGLQYLRQQPKRASTFYQGGSERLDINKVASLRADFLFAFPHVSEKPIMAAFGLRCWTRIRG